MTRNDDGARFNGGKGDDSVGVNEFASFDGGSGDDTVTTLDSTGSKSIFNGGGGFDTVTAFVGGTCVDVEVGCP